MGVFSRLFSREDGSQATESDASTRPSDAGSGTVTGGKLRSRNRKITPDPSEPSDHAGAVTGVTTHSASGVAPNPQPPSSPPAPPPKRARKATPPPLDPKLARSGKTPPAPPPANKPVAPPPAGVKGTGLTPEHAARLGWPLGHAAPGQPPPLPSARADGQASQPSAASVPPLPAADGAPPRRQLDDDEQTQVIDIQSPLSAAPLDELVDAAVDALLDPDVFGEGNERPAEHESDRRALLETFSAVAKLHGRPLRDLMFQLSLGRTPASWAGVCRPLLAPLLDAARQIEWTELTRALERFDSTLEHAAGEGASGGANSPIGDAARKSIQDAYDELRQHLPDVFAAPAPGDSRRLILFESLLLQVPSLHRRTIAKLYAAGLSSLGQLSQAKPEELTAVIGLDRGLAAAIVEHIQRFERDRDYSDPGALRAQIQLRLGTIAGRLAQLQAEFERADQEGSQIRKKAVRRAREVAVLEMDRLLAEIGDLQLIEELKRYPVRAKIRRLQAYLAAVQAVI